MQKIKVYIQATPDKLHSWLKEYYWRGNTTLPTEKGVYLFRPVRWLWGRPAIIHAVWRENPTELINPLFSSTPTETQDVMRFWVYEGENTTVEIEYSEFNELLSYAVALLSEMGRAFPSCADQLQPVIQYAHLVGFTHWATNTPLELPPIQQDAPNDDNTIRRYGTDRDLTAQR